MVDMLKRAEPLTGGLVEGPAIAPLGRSDDLEVERMANLQGLAAVGGVRSAVNGDADSLMFGVVVALVGAGLLQHFLNPCEHVRWQVLFRARNHQGADGMSSVVDMLLHHDGGAFVRVRPEDRHDDRGVPSHGERLGTFVKIERHYFFFLVGEMRVRAAELRRRRWRTECAVHRQR